MSDEDLFYTPGSIYNPEKRRTPKTRYYGEKDEEDQASHKKRKRTKTQEAEKKKGNR